MYDIVLHLPTESVQYVNVPECVVFEAYIASCGYVSLYVGGYAELYVSHSPELLSTYIPPEIPT